MGSRYGPMAGPQFRGLAVGSGPLPPRGVAFLSPKRAIWATRLVLTRSPRWVTPAEQMGTWTAARLGPVRRLSRVQMSSRGAPPGLQCPRAAWHGPSDPRAPACPLSQARGARQSVPRSPSPRPTCLACQAFSVCGVLAATFPPPGSPGGGVFSSLVPGLTRSMWCCRALPGRSEPRKTRDGHSWRMGPLFSLSARPLAPPPRPPVCAEGRGTESGPTSLICPRSRPRGQRRRWRGPETEQTASARGPGVLPRVGPSPAPRAGGSLVRRTRAPHPVVPVRLEWPFGGALERSSRPSVLSRVAVPFPRSQPGHRSRSRVPRQASGVRGAYPRGPRARRSLAPVRRDEAEKLKREKKKKNGRLKRRDFRGPRSPLRCPTRSLLARVEGGRSTEPGARAVPG
nr:uncharacterized protein LOC111749210 [Loxodonta africana]